MTRHLNRLMMQLLLLINLEKLYYYSSSCTFGKILEKLIYILNTKYQVLKKFLSFWNLDSLFQSPICILENIDQKRPISRFNRNSIGRMVPLNFMGSSCFSFKIWDQWLIPKIKNVHNLNEVFIVIKAMLQQTSLTIIIITWVINPSFVSIKSRKASYHLCIMLAS